MYSSLPQQLDNFQFTKSRLTKAIFNRSLFVDTRSYLVDNCLAETDRMCMTVSLE